MQVVPQESGKQEGRGRKMSFSSSAFKKCLGSASNEPLPKQIIEHPFWWWVALAVMLLAIGMLFYVAGLFVYSVFFAPHDTITLDASNWVCTKEETESWMRPQPMGNGKFIYIPDTRVVCAKYERGE